MNKINSSSGFSELGPSTWCGKVIQGVPLIYDTGITDRVTTLLFIILDAASPTWEQLENAMVAVKTVVHGLVDFIQNYSRKGHETPQVTRFDHCIVSSASSPIYWEMQLWRITVDMKYLWPFLWDNWWYCYLLHSDFENLTFVNMECSRAGRREIHARTT